MWSLLTGKTKLHGSEPILTTPGKRDCVSGLMRRNRGWVFIRAYWYKMRSAISRGLSILAAL